MKVVIIAAIAHNNVIGKDGKIPWYSEDDLKFFKETTLNYPVIMGRKTFQSIGKVLPNRINMVLSNSNLHNENILVYKNISTALSFCKKKKFEKVFIIGGESIYTQFMDIADELIISKFNLNLDGDRFFPNINFDTWTEYQRIDFNDFSVYYYLRK